MVNTYYRKKVHKKTRRKRTRKNKHKGGMPPSKDALATAAKSRTYKRTSRPPGLNLTADVEEQQQDIIPRYRAQVRHPSWEDIMEIPRQAWVSEWMRVNVSHSHIPEDLSIPKLSNYEQLNRDVNAWALKKLAEIPEEQRPASLTDLCKNTRMTSN